MFTEQTVGRRRRGRARKLLLLIGFLAAAAALLVARATPADGYEVSIYAATPRAFWAALGVGLVAAVAAWALAAGTGTDGAAGDGGPTGPGALPLVLLGLLVVAVVALPLVRGYHFYGLADALGHVSFARKIAAGHRSFYSVLYPGGHTVAIHLAQFAGWSIPRAMLATVVGFVGVFLLFVPLSVSLIVPDRRAVGFAALGACLLMPINEVSTTLQFHSFTLGTLFAPVAVFLLLAHLSGEADSRALPGPLSAATLLMPVVGFALVLVHPLAKFDLLVVFVATAGVQFVVGRLRPGHPLGRTRAVYGQVLVLVAIWAYWSVGHWHFGRTATQTARTFLATLDGGSTVAPGISSASESASGIGVSIWELFAKLFLVEALFTLLAVGTVLSEWVGRLRSPDREGAAAISYFAAGGVALSPLMFVQFHGQISWIFFRHVGFGMIFVTMLAAIGLYKLSTVVPTGRASARSVLAVVAVVLVVASAATVYASPFVYKHSHHVTEGHMEGYETAFERQPADAAVWFGSVRPGFNRYKKSLASKPGTPWYPSIVSPAPRYSGPVPGPNLTNVSGYYETHPESIVRRDHYLVVSEVDRGRELVAYDGLRYSAAQFASMSRQQNLHRIRANGHATGYYADLPTPEIGPDAGANATAEGDPDAFTSLRAPDGSIASAPTPAPAPSSAAATAPEAAGGTGVAPGRTGVAGG